MLKVRLYGLPHCTTCKKALAFLEAAGVRIEEFHDLKEDRLSRQEVAQLSALAGGADKLFSKRARKYRSMGLSEKAISDDEMIELMSEEYTFIRRPVLVAGKKAFAGFSKTRYQELTG